MAEVKDVVTAILTPFAEDGAIDYGYMWRHLRMQEENGVAVVAPCGTNGEGQSLSLEERKAVIRFVVENKGGMAVLAGTGCLNLPETIELTLFAERVGADAALVVPPYFMPPTYATGLPDYFRRLFDAVSIPIILYNIPMFTGVEISHELLHQLQDYPHLYGVKDTSGDVERSSDYLREFPDLKVFSGFDSLIERSLQIGVHGVISGSSNVIPDLIVRIYNEFRAGKPVTELQQRISHIRKELDKYPFLAANKSALSLLGFPLTHVRPPLVDLTQDQCKSLADGLRRLGIIE